MCRPRSWRFIGGARSLRCYHTKYTRILNFKDFLCQRWVNKCLLHSRANKRPGLFWTLSYYSIKSCLQNTNVLINIYSSQMDPEMWEDPKSFRPARFLNSKGDVVNEHKLLTFSIGNARTSFCIGNAHKLKWCSVAIVKFFKGNGIAQGRL